MQEFFVDHYRVDLQRNHIVCEGDVIPLEPKVLSVLAVLAERSGEVVSHQTLHDLVWPNMVVAPNALQRCIGQLRKALNDDGKTQRVIVTHPKKGYSLVAVVRRFHPPASQNSPESEIVNLSPSISSRWTVSRWLPLLILSLLVLIVGVVGNFLTGQAPLSGFNRLTPLTATDASEFYSVFSPDGRYVVFSRIEQKGQGHLWLLDLTTRREILLTREAGRFGQPNWSTDGKRLAFLDLNGCQQSCLTPGCVNVNVLYIPLALSEPQPARQLVNCEAIPLQGLQWIDDQQLVAIRHQGDDSEIISIDSRNGAIGSLYLGEGQNWYALSYSSVNQQLAIMEAYSQRAPALWLYSPLSGDIRAGIFTPPPRYRSSARWYPIWDPSGERLLFSAGPRLYLMDSKGQLHSQMIPTFQDISRPMLHPDGRSIAMTLGKVDRDMAQLSLSEFSGQANLYSELPLFRSILRENDGQYQPGGDGVAFFSQRGGSRQLWLARQNSEVQPLTRLADTYPEYFVWAPNGQQLLVSSEHQLYLTDLQGKVETLPLPFRATALFEWTENNQLLMQIVDDNQTRLIRYHLDQNRYETLHLGHTLWAQTDGQQVFFIDEDHRLKQLVNGEVETISETRDIQIWSRFFVAKDQLYLLASDDQLWRFDLKERSLHSILTYPDTTVALTDVTEDGKRFLISKQVSSKKEIVLLTPYDH